MKNKKILIVDDEKNIRISLEKCLASSEYEIELANDGKEALDKILKGKYDLILMDVQMPKMNGLDVLTKIRKEGVSTRVIMMTAFGTVDIAVDAMKLGAVDFISKPFTVKKVKDLVKDVINKDKKVLIVDSKIETYIKSAREAVISKEYEKAKTYLHEALVKDTSNPEIQNLLGVIEEKTGSRLLAQKYYRAALSLDATYVPADNNLKRTVIFTSSIGEFDLG